MTNLPIPYSNIKPINLDTEMSGEITITAAPVQMFGMDMKTTRFVRTDGKPSHKIKLRVQDMDIEVELTDDEVGIWSNYLSVVFTEKVLQMADISDDGWLD